MTGCVKHVRMSTGRDVQNVTCATLRELACRTKGLGWAEALTKEELWNTKRNRIPMTSMTCSDEGSARRKQTVLLHLREGNLPTRKRKRMRVTMATVMTMTIAMKMLTCPSTIWKMMMRRMRMMKMCPSMILLHQTLIAKMPSRVRGVPTNVIIRHLQIPTTTTDRRGNIADQDRGAEAVRPETAGSDVMKRTVKEQESDDVERRGSLISSPITLVLSLEIFSRNTCPIVTVLVLCDKRQPCVCVCACVSIELATIRGVIVYAACRIFAHQPACLHAILYKTNVLFVNRVWKFS